LTVNVAYSKDGPDTVLVQAPADKEPAKADATAMAESSAAGGAFEYDPWEPFNEKMFWFNREVLDRFVLKPVATAWDFVLPTPVQKGIYNVFDNLAVVRRVVSNALQLKFTGAAKEAARFTINSTIGVTVFLMLLKKALASSKATRIWG
jgi:phospholipid-binding lipoprotein MlaA